MGQHPLGGGVVAGEHVDDARADRGQGDGPAARAGGDAHAERLARELGPATGPRSGGPASARRSSPSASRKRPITSPTAPFARRRACSSSSTKPGREVRAVRGRDARARRPRWGRARAASIVSRIAGSSISASRRSALPTMAGAARPRNVGARCRGEALQDLVGARGLRRARRGTVELHDLRRVGPAHRQAARDREHRAAPGHGDRSRGPLPGEEVHGDLGDGVPRQVVGLLARGGGGHVRDDGGAQAEARRRARPPARRGGPSGGRPRSGRSTPRRRGPAGGRPGTGSGPSRSPISAWLRCMPVVQLRDPHHEADIAGTPTPDCEHSASASAHMSSSNAHVCGPGTDYHWREACQGPPWARCPSGSHVGRDVRAGAGTMPVIAVADDGARARCEVQGCGRRRDDPVHEVE